jgi:dipeptidyl aminopeptidase/acylaminoacyl peptidase
MKIKIASTAVLLCAAVIAGMFPAAATQAAGFTYGSISITPGSNQGLLTYRTLDSKKSQLCDLTTFICNASVDSLPPAITGEIGQGSYSLSPSGKLAFVAEASVSRGTLNNVYKVVDGKLGTSQTLPISGYIYRILFSPGDTHVVARTATALISVDLKTNTILGTAPWTFGDFFAFAQVSPNGRLVAYYSSATQTAPTRNFRIVDLLKKKTYTLSQKLPYWDLLSEENMLFQFSPDGKFLFYKDDRNGPQTIYKVDLAKLVQLKGKEFLGKRIFTKPYTVSDFVLVDSRTLLYLANRETPLRFDLYSYDLITGALKTVATNASYHPAIKRAGDLVFVNQLVSWGSQVMAYNPKTGVLRALPAPVGTFATLKSGTDIVLPGGVHGALILPDNFVAKSPHKLVIWLHGGPFRQTSLGYHPYSSYGVYDWMLEGLRASGVVVLKLDYSGSFGYGRPFAESLQNNVGVKDVKDVLAALSSLKAKYNLSETHLMGISYGGYLAMRSLVEKPTSFASAISINGVSDWLTLVNNNPNTIFAADFKGPLTTANEQIYDRASIWAKLPGLTSQKVVLLHSTMDSEISFSQSTKVAGILESAGKNVELIKLEGDDHVLGFQKNAITVCKTTFKTLGIEPGDKCVL